MHELSIAAQLVEQGQRLALNNKASQVKKITLQIGLLAGIEKQSLLFCFPIAAQGSLLEGAKLKIDICPIVIWCPNCKKERTRKTISLACPRCKNSTGELIRGKEIIIKSMEVEI